MLHTIPCMKHCNRTRPHRIRSGIPSRACTYRLSASCTYRRRRKSSPSSKGLVDRQSRASTRRRLYCTIDKARCRPCCNKRRRRSCRFGIAIRSCTPNHWLLRRRRLRCIRSCIHYQGRYRQRRLCTFHPTRRFLPHCKLCKRQGKSFRNIRRQRRSCSCIPYLRRIWHHWVVSCNLLRRRIQLRRRIRCRDLYCWQSERTCRLFVRSSHCCTLCTYRYKRFHNTRGRCMLG